MEPLSIPQILAQTARVPVKSPKLACLLVVAFLATTAIFYYTSNFYVLYHDVRPLLGFLFRDMFVIEESGVTFVSKAVTGQSGNTSVSVAAFEIEEAVDGALKDTLQIFKEEFLYWVASYLLSVSSWIAFVHFTEVVHLGKRVTSGELLSRVRGSLGGTLVTCLFASLLILAYVSALTLPMELLVSEPHKSGRLVLLSLFLLAIPALLSLLFLSFLADLARVVSVLEGCYGPAAFAKAWEVLKERRLQGFLLTFLLLVAAFVVLEPFHLAEVTMLKDGPFGAMLALDLVKVVVMGLLTVFSIMAFAVFYIDCKRCYGERTASVGVELQFDKLISEEEDPLP